MLSTLYLSSSFPLPCFSTSQNKGGNFFEISFSKLLLTFPTGPYARFVETNQIAAQTVAIQSDFIIPLSGQLFGPLTRIKELVKVIGNI